MEGEGLIGNYLKYLNVITTASVHQCDHMKLGALFILCLEFWMDIGLDLVCELYSSY